MIRLVSSDYQVVGDNDAAPFTLKVHRGEGMALLAMNWKDARPPDSFVGFAIEYTEPGGDAPSYVKNRLAFLQDDGSVAHETQDSNLAPIQMFRWVHFPWHADLTGDFTYAVRPVFMDEHDKLSLGEAQQARLELGSETYPGRLNVAFTRGFISSQAFVDHSGEDGDVSTLLPASADDGLTFKATHPKADEAHEWMGFEARKAVLAILDEALHDDTDAQVRVVAYDLNEPEIVDRLKGLGKRLKVIIDDSGSHGEPGSAENQAADELEKMAEAMKRQHMGGLQHNKTIVVDGPKVQAAVFGSTNFSWRGLYVQSNNAIVVRGAQAVKLGSAAFDAYWDHGDVAGFGHTDAALMHPLGLDGIDAQVAFSPHVKAGALLDEVANDIETGTTSSLLYSLAFLYQTHGAVRNAVTSVTEDDAIFVYGMSDRKVGGIELQKPDGNVQPVRPEALTKNVPEPFKSEPTGGSGIRLHHKFVVIDFDKPTARVWMGSYNFSGPADTSNGENLVLIKDRRVATSYMVEALRLFDHYRFRILEEEKGQAGDKLYLLKPPREPGDVPWWDKFYTDAQKARDREMFA
jgi:phosphatidylserine/phosphatidylglycerophosphate/cardiolipin synthase-like enzyme